MAFLPNTYHILFKTLKVRAFDQLLNSIYILLVKNLNEREEHNSPLS